MHGDDRAMSPVSKVLLLLALVVPMAAYVAGSLTAPDAPEPADRSPVILRDADVSPATSTPSPTRSPSTRPSDRKAGDDDDDDDSSGRGSDDDSGRGQQEEARVVNPLPTPVGEDDDDEWDEDGPDDDDDTDDESDDSDDSDDGDD